MDPHRPEPDDQLPPNTKSPQPPHSPARDEDSINTESRNVGDDGAGVDKPGNDAENATDQGESVAASRADSSQMESSEFAPELDSPAVSHDADSEELSATSAMPLSVAIDAESAEPASDTNVDDDLIASDELPSDTVGANASDAFVDGPAQQASAPEIVKPADEWWWGSPSWASRSVASEVGLDSPSGAVGEPLASDASRTPTPPDRHDGPAIIERLPYVPSEQPEGVESYWVASPTTTNPPSAGMSVDSSPASPSAAPQQAASLPLALPVMVRATEPLVQQVLDASRAMFIQLAEERAEWKINEHEHWKACELRAINGPGW